MLKPPLPPHYIPPPRLFLIPSSYPGAPPRFGAPPPDTPIKNTFRCAVRKFPPILFAGATRPKSSKLHLSLWRVAPNPMQNTFPLCRKKILPILFVGATRPQVFQILTYSRRVAPNPTKKNTLPLIPGAYVKNQIKFSLPLRELLRFLRQKPCVRGLFRRIS